MTYVTAPRSKHIPPSDLGQVYMSNSGRSLTKDWSFISYFCTLTEKNHRPE